jgi:hypothetical protein
MKEHILKKIDKIKDEYRIFDEKMKKDMFF